VPVPRVLRTRPRPGLSPARPPKAAEGAEPLAVLPPPLVHVSARSDEIQRQTPGSCDRVGRRATRRASGCGWRSGREAVRRCPCRGMREGRPETPGRRRRLSRLSGRRSTAGLPSLQHQWGVLEDGQVRLDQTPGTPTPAAADPSSLWLLRFTPQIRGMELNGTLSNPLTSDKRLQMARLAAVKSDLSIRERAPDWPSPRLPRRQGSVLATVTNILETAAEPLCVQDIHRTVETLIGEPVPCSSVKDALATHARGDDRRFRRTRRGRYALA